VVIHELAHGFGVNHHDGPACVINMVPGQGSELGIDLLTHELCSRCIGIIRDNVQELPEVESEPAST
jgi:predicted Zn-dependent protease